MSEEDGGHGVNLVHASHFKSNQTLISKMLLETDAQRVVQVSPVALDVLIPGDLVETYRDGVSLLDSGLR